MDKIKIFQEELKNKILVLDGATGTAIQKYNLSEEDFRGELFKNNQKNLQGCNEILNLTCPKIIKEIHQKYLEAGADIIETNSFNGNRYALSDYNLDELAYELSKKSAILAVEVSREFFEKTKKKTFVAGSIGPTNKSCGISSANTKNNRETDFDSMKEVYREQISGLIDGGVEIILIETIFDGLNAKAALIATEELFEEKNISLPIMISATVDKNGKILSGQSIESLILALDRESIISYGFNCSFGAKDLVPLILKLEKITDKNISLYPNAGLPNEKGEYDENPEIMVKDLLPLIENSKINILGGCCGTTYEHIKLISETIKNKKPRNLPDKEKENLKINNFFLSGNEILEKKDFYKVGERNNVAGSKIFKTLIEEKNYSKAIDISREQVKAGADLIDINFDDGFLDSKNEMIKFLKILQSDPITSKIPVMIDSSDFETIEAGLKNISGKPIVNSISLKEGEEKFIKKIKILKKYGAAVVVMAFDEKGQGVSYERKIEICSRAYKILVENNFPSSDIIFDPNILSIGTGSQEDLYNGLNFIKATEYLRKTFPKAGVSGGLSNVSFSFRGNNLLRAAIHKVFLDICKKNNLNMAIINPQEVPPEISQKDYEKIENLILGKENALEEIFKISFISDKKPKVNFENKIKLTTVEKIEEALINGNSTTFEEDINELLQENSAIYIIQNILMKGMERVGKLFEKGELYLPQIIGSASMMEKAIKILSPELEKNATLSKRGKVLLATVEGDVHDIGKNIVGTVLRCNGFEIIDLGIMTPGEKIFEIATKNEVDVVLLSGLITPSLREMAKVLELFNENKSEIPILVGGAATSKLHTAIKLKNIYSGKVLYCGDASSTVNVVSKICQSKEEQQKYLKSETDELEKLEKIYNQNQNNNQIKKEKINYDKEMTIPKKLGKDFIKINLSQLESLLNYEIILHTLKVKNTPEEAKVLQEINLLYKKMSENNNYIVNCAFGFFPCEKVDNNLKINYEEKEFILETEYLADFFMEKDYVGAFAISVEGNLAEEKDEYKKILENLISTRIAEAASEFLQKYLTKEYWEITIRPAVGYSSLPNHEMIKIIFDLIDGYKTGATLSKTCAMSPIGSVCGIYISNPKAYYFDVKKL